jgi:uncharacterized OB-fold protein
MSVDSTDPASPGPGTVYTETVVFSPPEAFAADVPYQLAILSLDSGGRLTGRILGERASIGDRVDFVEFKNHVAYFQKLKP